jgi:hypothetical protein
MAAPQTNYTTREDAYNQVLAGRLGSLSSNASEEYLGCLLVFIDQWREEVSTALHQKWVQTAREEDGKRSTEDLT